MKAILVPWARALAALGACIALGAFTFTAATRTVAAPRPSAAEPLFAARADHLLWSDDFDVPALARGRPGEDGRYGRYVTLGAPHLQFDDGAGVSGSGALRISWAASADRSGRACVDDSRLIEASFPPSRELIVQFSVRYTPGFVFDWSRGGRCRGNAKKLFLLWAREGSRFVFISENGWLGIGSDEDHPLFRQNRANIMTPAALADGRWHRITFHVRQSSAPGRADGAIAGWIDGEARWAYDGVVTHNAGGYHLFKFPATFNQGSPVAQTEWVDDLRVWRPR
jgi:hypothetical protein